MVLHGAHMHLAEPRLYWRVKQPSGRWLYVPAHFVFVEQSGAGMLAMISLPAPPSQGDAESE